MHNNNTTTTTFNSYCFFFYNPPYTTFFSNDFVLGLEDTWVRGIFSSIIEGFLWRKEEYNACESEKISRCQD